MEILVVENEKNQRRLLSVLLSGRMLRLAKAPVVREAGSIEEAKAILAISRPDLILLDWQLDDGTGADLIDWIREQAGDPPPVLVLTACAQAAEIAQISSTLQALRGKIVLKPFEPRDLVPGIVALLGAVSVNPAS